MAFARVKVRWAKMDAVKLVTEGPPEGKEHRTPERYFEDVLEGSRIVATQCAKGRHYLLMNIFMLSLPCMMKQSRYII